MSITNCCLSIICWYFVRIQLFEKIGNIDFCSGSTRGIAWSSIEASNWCHRTMQKTSWWEWRIEGNIMDDLTFSCLIFCSHCEWQWWGSVMASMYQLLICLLLRYICSQLIWDRIRIYIHIHNSYHFCVHLEQMMKNHMEQSYLSNWF